MAIATLRAIWNLIYGQRAEAVWGLVWALAIWLVFDLLRLGSFLRSLPGEIQDSLASRSRIKLILRIAELKDYRNTLDLYLTSDRAIYLHTLSFVIGMLISMCAAGMLLMLGELGLLKGPASEVLALGMLALAMVFGRLGLQRTSWDTPGKIHETAAKIDGQIAALERKLDARRRS